jgi:hypothetical protein
MISCPLPTKRELRLEVRDRLQGAHWASGRCWCAAFHEVEATTLDLVPPPWDASRLDESAFPTAVAW